MIIRRIAVTAMLVLTLAAWGAPMTATSAHAEGQQAATAEEFIAGLSDRAVQALTTEGVARPERIKRFRGLLQANFDVQLIGKWVLGRYWRAASDDEKTQYLKLFEDYVVITYVDRFDQYSGEKLYVVNAVAEPGKDALVYTEIRRPSGGEPIRVNWRVRGKANDFKIIDVYVEGISMSQTQRKEFTSIVRAKGGKVAGLLDVLRTKIDELDGNATAAN